MEKTITGKLSSLAYGRKVLFANVPADGHFGPLTGIAKHLQQEGYDVRWYCSTEYEARIRKLGIPFYPFRTALNVTGTNLEQMLPERCEHKSEIARLNFDLTHFFVLRSTEYYADIRDIYTSFPFDMMIADC